MYTAVRRNVSGFLLCASLTMSVGWVRLIELRFLPDYLLASMCLCRGREFIRPKMQLPGTAGCKYCHRHLRGFGPGISNYSGKRDLFRSSQHWDSRLRSRNVHYKMCFPICGPILLYTLEVRESRMTIVHPLLSIIIVSGNRSWTLVHGIYRASHHRVL